MMFTVAKPAIFLTAKDHITRRVITGPTAANSEVEFFQSRGEAVLALAEKFIEKAIWRIVVFVQSKKPSPVAYFFNLFPNAVISMADLAYH
jgi:hypothetical protein